MENKKVTRKDLPIIKGTIEVDCIKIDGKTINLTQVPQGDIKNYITHDNCITCGEEFKKPFTYCTRCQSCVNKHNNQIFNNYELVEWNGETPLCVFDDDTYFFSSDDIIQYCEDHECLPSQLQLVTCTTSNLSEIDFDHWMDEVDEDWEPSPQLVMKLNELNEFLSKESSNTWFASNKRVDVSPLDVEKEVEQ